MGDDKSTRADWRVMICEMCVSERAELGDVQRRQVQVKPQIEEKSSWRWARGWRRLMSGEC